MNRRVCASCGLWPVEVPSRARDRSRRRRQDVGDPDRTRRSGPHPPFKMVAGHKLGLRAGYRRWVRCGFASNGRSASARAPKDGHPFVRHRRRRVSSHSSRCPLGRACRLQPLARHRRRQLGSRRRCDRGGDGRGARSRGGLAMRRDALAERCRVHVRSRPGIRGCRRQRLFACLGWPRYLPHARATYR